MIDQTTLNIKTEATMRMKDYQMFSTPIWLFLLNKPQLVKYESSLKRINRQKW